MEIPKQMTKESYLDQSLERLHRIQHFQEKRVKRQDSRVCSSWEKSSERHTTQSQHYMFVSHVQTHIVYALVSASKHITQKSIFAKIIHIYILLLFTYNYIYLFI